MFPGHRWFSLITSVLLIRLSHAQLFGSITSPGNPFIITITINNPSSNNISILKWNNVFDDQLLIPPSFTIKDDGGNDTPFATTYALRSGITANDFHSLEPGQNFTRIYDLRQFLQDIPSRVSGPGPHNIQIVPPASFQGIIPNGPLMIPVEAAADITRGVLGDYSAAGLKSISLTAAPYTVQLNFPIFEGSESNSTILSDGVQLDHGTCTGTNATILNDAIFDAGVYANSVHLASVDTSSTLFPQFFQTSQRSAVSNASESASLTIQGNGPHVDVYCSDLDNLCDSEGSILGYSFTPSFLGSSYLVLCPAARNLGRAPDPCSAPSGKQLSASASHVMFHLTMTLNNAVRSIIGNNYYGAQAVLQLANSTTVNATTNADSYAQLGIAQWAYGEGGTPYSGPACPPANGLVPGNQKRTKPAKSLEQHLPARVGPRAVLSRRQGLEDLTVKQVAEGTQQCTGAQLTLVHNAGANIRALAAAARDNPDGHLWKQTFNGDLTIQRQVWKIFDTIAKWNTTGNDAGISFLCDPQRKSWACRFGTNAILLGYPATQTAQIILCPNFFYQPQTLECEVPSTQNPYISEMTGSLMHELLHIRWLVNRVINDGVSSTGEEAQCYNWNCVTNYAQSRKLPTFDPRNYPENVAAAYEYYAYAARAAVTDCSWTTYVGSMFGLGALNG